MVLEATIVCVDNSEWMRNGDYTPTRMEAQHDAVNLICGAKTQQNPENVVGTVASAGKSPEVLVTLTSDLGKLLSSMHGIKLSGQLKFMQTIQVAQLVLKHRLNKSQHQRIIFFVGSPIADPTEELVKLAKRMKKNNIAVDIVNFGEEEANTEKLEAFISAINSNDNSHLVNIPPGPHILSDIIITSPIVTGGEDSGMAASSTAGGAAATGSGFAAYGGVDPNLDPELALVLKISMEEERARQEAEAKASSSGEEKPAPAQTSTNEAIMDDLDDPELAAALAMSQQPTTSSSSSSSSAQKSDTVSQTPTTSSTTTTTTTPSTPTIKEEEMGEADDPELALALQMSYIPSSSNAAQSPAQKPETPDINKVMEDPNFVNSVLSSLPGVDPNDEAIKSVLASLNKPADDKDKQEKK